MFDPFYDRHLINNKSLSQTDEDQNSVEIEPRKPADVIFIEEDEKIVERILDKRLNKQSGRIEYLVKWHDYPIESSDWVRYEHFDSKSIIIDFE
jgi:hypothetical protein